MNSVSAVTAKVVATVFGVGYCPVAPGSAGTLVALVLYYLVRPEPTTQVAMLVSIFVVGTVSAHYAERAFGRKDSGQIVIDEVAGYAVSVLLLPMTTGYLLAGFVLFRIFDIFKPPPVRQAERVFPGGLGVVMDDVAAGVYVNILLQLFRVTF